MDWRAALITGGLPVSYSVKSSVLYRDYDFGDCFNFNPACLELPDETDPKKRFVHERGKLYSCVVLMNADFTELDYINCFYGPYTYKVWITAENEVGSANSFVGLDVIPEHYKYSNSKSTKHPLLTTLSSTIIHIRVLLTVASVLVKPSLDCAVFHFTQAVCDLHHTKSVQPLL